MFLLLFERFFHVCDFLYTPYFIHLASLNNRYMCSDLVSTAELVFSFIIDGEKRRLLCA